MVIRLMEFVLQFKYSFRIHWKSKMDILATLKHSLMMLMVKDDFFPFIWSILLNLEKLLNLKVWTLYVNISIDSSPVNDNFCYIQETFWQTSVLRNLWFQIKILYFNNTLYEAFYLVILTYHTIYYLFEPLFRSFHQVME